MIRVEEQKWKFLWSVPALLLDGWSWPLVFRDVSISYQAYSSKSSPDLKPAPPYKAYLEWNSSQQADESIRFWTENLKGFTQATSVPVESGMAQDGHSRYQRSQLRLPEELSSTLNALARKQQITVNTIVQGAWALLLSKQSKSQDVVFGAAFAGRPSDMPDVESIVGPFVNTLPVRVQITQADSAADYLRSLHMHLLAISTHQYTPLIEIQRCSAIGWQHRIFDSIVVFQNYKVDEAAMRLGRSVEISDFDGPIHTNFPLTLVAEPSDNLHLTLVYDSRTMSHSSADRLLGDMNSLLAKISTTVELPLTGLLSCISEPVSVASSKQTLRSATENLVLPQTPMECAIAEVWRQMLGVPEVSIEDSLFDAGGHSLLIVQMHRRLTEVLRQDFPLITLFQHPTIRSLAKRFEAPSNTTQEQDRLRDRAQKQQQAFSRFRNAAKKL